ncbi:L-2-hydroxyglutarate dehydrogenase, mitochondrial [Ananas comosus]|uniref:L-2-hydroxyglutarate dehydrogenase, mitochondrial n=1 Tax=Ananas comosus TaxID=4615 RepID=A0A6P5H2M9_ANACO|nr:L-2-hydroxyglutarate dehydrogenase, mitochondrial [Ananas comosus]
MLRSAGRRRGSALVAAAAAGRRWVGSGATMGGGGAPREAADAVVVGAGVVGLAVARALAMAGRDVLVVEAASAFGTGTSSRNSEVIHAGIYHPPNSLKARLCVRGKELLYRYCSERGIPHKQIGKLIVASSVAEVPKLEILLERGKENGVRDLRMMEGSEALQMEPEVRCVKAILSPSSGIIDSHELMLSLVGEAESFGTTLSYNTTVIGGHVEDGGLHLDVCLSALPLAKRFHGLRQEVVPAAYYARGCYFTLSQTKSPPFRRLIYPIPEVGGIGVHVTLDLNGLVKFGPDVEWIDGVDDISSFLNRYDYYVNSDRASKFYQVIRKYFPNLKDGSLEPGYSGIRPKLSGPQQPPSDFLIQGEDSHGVPGLINLFGIESPGLTSCLGIAEYIVSKYLKS